MKETLSYRARKWLFQRVTSNRGATQHERLSDTDWDVLVILDACKASCLRAVADWPVETVVSPNSCTPAWLREAQESGVLRGSHIVSANPQYEKVTIDATVEPYYESHWDDRLSTVLPESVLDRADELADEEKVVAHLQQPHWPYVAKLDGSWELAYPDVGPWGEANEIDSTQVAMQRGHVEIETARQAYRASVRSVWETVVQYLRRWSERSLTAVVTSDHGETFGRIREMKLYEHPCNCHLSRLTRAPWVEVGPDSATSAQTEAVEDRIKALGYKE